MFEHIEMVTICLVFHLQDLVVENRKDLDRLLNTAQFHETGLWQLVQHLTSQLRSISDRALHQKLWQFVVHVINAADLKSLVFE